LIPDFAFEKWAEGGEFFPWGATFPRASLGENVTTPEEDWGAGRRKYKEINALVGNKYTGRRLGLRENVTTFGNFVLEMVPELASLAV